MLRVDTLFFILLIEQLSLIWSWWNFSQIAPEMLVNPTRNKWNSNQNKCNFLISINKWESHLHFLSNLWKTTNFISTTQRILFWIHHKSIIKKTKDILYIFLDFLKDCFAKSKNPQWKGEASLKKWQKCSSGPNEKSNYH